MGVEIFIELKAWMLAMAVVLVQRIMTVATNTVTKGHFLPRLLPGALQVPLNHTLATSKALQVPLNYTLATSKVIMEPAITRTWEVVWVITPQ